MSAADSDFVFLTEDDLEVAPAPRADRFVEPDKRVKAFPYQCGVVELRSARDGEYINTDKPVHTRDFR